MNGNIRSAMILIIMLIVSMIGANGHNIVHASTGAGSGGATSGGGTAPWWHASGQPWTGSGTSQAWKTFNSMQSRSESRLKETLNNKVKGSGFQGMSLYESCKRSQFIWWYGQAGTGNFRTEIGSNAHKGVPKGSIYAQRAWDDFTDTAHYKNYWGKRGGTVIVCSGSYIDPAPKRPITLTANSGEFIYNGKTQSVTGFKLTKGSLKSGHKISNPQSNAKGSRRTVGNAKVNFNKNIVIRKGKTNVTNQYKITTVPGSVKILSKPKGAGERCKTTSTDSITSIINSKVDASVSVGPDNVPKPGDMESSKKENEAGKVLKDRPNKDDSKASWSSWKSKFSAGGKGKSNLTTGELFIQEGPGEFIRKNGGILNVIRTHEQVKVDVEFCQPQERKPTIVNGSSGWTKWKNVGKEKINKITQKKITPKTYSYQILGVNCNIEGFNQVLDYLGDEKVEVNHSYGKGTASGSVETKPVAGTNNFPLGKNGHFTSKSEFYTDGPSCKDSFENACVSTPLGVDAKNDANNNIQNNESFAHKDEVEYVDNNPAGFSMPSEKGVLNFFRDNKDREVRADVWYPKKLDVEDIVTYPNEPAYTTSAKIFTGTPEIEVTTIKKAGDSDSNKIDELNSEVKWDEHVNYLDIKSQWASENNKPYEIGLNWAYKAGAIQKFPVRIDGHEVLETETKETKFDVHCQFMNDGTKSYDANVPKNPFANSTLNSFKWNDENSIRTIFTRSVSDKITKETEKEERQ